MSTKENKAASRRWIEEGFNKQDLNVANEVFAVDCDFHDDWYCGVDEMKRHCSAVFAAFPGAHMTIEDQFAEGDRVATRWTLCGTHKGPLFGIPPTGKEVTIKAVYIDRYVDGIVVESRKYGYAFEMLLELGAIQSPFTEPQQNAAEQLLARVRYSIGVTGRRMGPERVAQLL